MHLFGLTGGIASGKSAAAARFRARGVPVIDADALAREAVAPGTGALEEIAAALGGEVITPAGELDRKRVADIVFRDSSARARLNAIVHPRIGALTITRTAELASRGEPLACYEAALIVENGMVEMFRPLVVVSAPEELQVARAMARDGATADEARARVQAQMPLASKVSVADVVLENTGTLAALVARADGALDVVCARVKVDPSRYPRPA
jgi:dephospho-CoA kinase